MTVTYASFCCSKDIDRAMETCNEHANSHAFPFAEKIMVFQRCQATANQLAAIPDFKVINIHAHHYPPILEGFGIQYPDPVLDELTHGWGAPHFWAHHMVNHLSAANRTLSDYIVFADADCHMKNQPEDRSWIEDGIKLLESRPDLFVISPNDGGPERLESIMSQQMFLVNRMRFLRMEFIPWDGKFIEGGPFQEYYGLLEGWIARHMAKNGLSRYVMNPEFRYYHKQWH
jgi:hypothetical protein